MKSKDRFPLFCARDLSTISMLARIYEELSLESRGRINKVCLCHIRSRSSGGGLQLRNYQQYAAAVEGFMDGLGRGGLLGKPEMLQRTCGWRKQREVVHGNNTCLQARSGDFGAGNFQLIFCFC